MAGPGAGRGAREDDAVDTPECCGVLGPVGAGRAGGILLTGLFVRDTGAAGIGGGSSTRLVRASPGDVEGTLARGIWVCISEEGINIAGASLAFPLSPSRSLTSPGASLRPVSRLTNVRVH